MGIAPFSTRVPFRRALVACLSVALSGGAFAAVVASFTPLGFLPGGPFTESVAIAVSGNGNVVAGFGSSANVAAVNDYEAFRWAANSGMQGLGSLGGSKFYSRAAAVSGNGQVVVGMSIGPNGEEAFRWQSSTGMVGLGDLPGLSFNSQATGVSRDGSVVVGYSLGAQDFHAFRWTAQSGMVDLGDLPGGFPFSAAAAVSGDGNTVVGYSYTAAGKEAFRWTDSDGMQSLGDLAGGAVESYARAISENGQVIVGMASSAVGYEAFRWTAAGGLESIGSCGGRLTSAFSTTQDGDWVFGNCLDEYGAPHAFVWDQNSGLRDLTKVLSEDFGLANELMGWELGNASVSSDGRTLAGYGKFQGQTQAWMVEFRGNVAEPSVAALWSLALTALALATRRRASRPSV